jgi:hypothetical protein
MRSPIASIPNSDASKSTKTLTLGATSFDAKPNPNVLILPLNLPDSLQV